MLGAPACGGVDCWRGQTRRDVFGSKIISTTRCLVWRGCVQEGNWGHLSGSIDVESKQTQVESICSDSLQVNTHIAVVTHQQLKLQHSVVEKWRRYIYICICVTAWGRKCISGFRRRFLSLLNCVHPHLWCSTGSKWHKKKDNEGFLSSVPKGLIWINSSWHIQREQILRFLFS